MNDLGITDSRTKAGYYAGPIGSVYMLGRALGSFYWGNFIDKYGRKNGLLIALVNIIVNSILFGVCSNYPLILILRGVTGMLAPIPAIAKTVVSEICSKQDAARGMAIFISGWYIGMILGTLIGGVFSHPEELGLVSSGILVDYPYLLPNLICAGMAAITLGLVIGMFRETLKRDETEMMIQIEEIEGFSYWEILKSDMVPTILFIYAVQSFNATAFSDVYPIWCWADVRDGGLHYNPTQIGLTLGISYFLIAFVQQKCYDILHKRMGSIAVMNLSSIILIPVIMLFPEQNLLVSYPLLLKISLIISMILWNLFYFNIFTSISLITNNSVTPNKRAKLNSIGMFVGSIFKGVGPYVAATLFSATASSGLPFPLDYHFIFYLLAINFLISLYFSKKLPNWLETGPSSESLEIKSINEEI